VILDARFDLAALAKARGSRRSVIVLQPTPPRLAFEQALYRIIMQVLAPAGARRDDLLAAASLMRSTLTQDAFTLSTIMAALRSSFAQGVAFSQGKVDSLFGAEGRRHDEKWMDQVNRVVGVDLRAVVRGADIAPTIELATQANVALIRGLTEEVAKRIETTIIDLVSRGAGTPEIAKALTEIGGFTRSRAKLIAVDQAESFNAKLNQIRQEQAGVTSYIWSTSRDRRVRPLHQQREGQRFRWDSPPSDGHPGQPVRCRCIARAVLDLDEVPARSSKSRASREGLRAVAAEFGI
jgi:SPP1 gp7 family putative phage head morphogenesis protein